MPVLRQRSRDRATGHPRLVVGWVHDHYVPDHARVLRTAELSTQQVICAGFRRPKPQSRIAAGNDVLLYAELRHKKTVDHVLRSHDQLDISVNRNVQLIDLSLPFNVLDLPHPLLSDDIDFGGITRRRAHLEVDHRSPGKDHEKNAERNNRPCDFEDKRSFDLLRLTTMPTPVLHPKNGYSRGNPQRHYR